MEPHCRTRIHIKRVVVSLSPLLAIMAAQPMILSQTAFSQTGAAQSDSSPMANVAGMLGKPAPQFVVMTLDGKQVSLSAYKGKALIVNFWATWCGACRLEMPWLAQLREQYAGNGFEIVGIVTDGATEQKVRQIVGKYGVDYPVFRCNHTTAQAYGGIPYLPESFYIDKTGHVVLEQADAKSKEEIEANIRKLLGFGVKWMTSTARCNLILICLIAMVWNVPFFAQETIPLGTPMWFNTRGDILTGDGLTSADPMRVSALAIRNGIILAVRTDAKMLRLRGKETELVDLCGAFAMPGFNDAHVHLASAGREKLTIDPVGVTSLQEMQQRIALAAKIAPAGAWLRGRGWDRTTWTPKQDLVTGDHPAILTRVDGHIAVANSEALRRAEIGAATANPSGGKIDRDNMGQPTAIVRETAVDLVYSKLPAPSPEERRQALELAIHDAIAHGINSLQDYSTWDDFLVYEQMEWEDKLPVRISEWLTFLDPLPVWERERAHHPADDSMLTTGMLKGFMDGSLGSRTAALLAPYTDDPGNSGILLCVAIYPHPAVKAKGLRSAEDCRKTS